MLARSDAVRGALGAPLRRMAVRLPGGCRLCRVRYVFAAPQRLFSGEVRPGKAVLPALVRGTLRGVQGWCAGQGWQPAGHEGSVQLPGKRDGRESRAADFLPGRFSLGSHVFQRQSCTGRGKDSPPVVRFEPAGAGCPDSVNGPPITAVSSEVRGPGGGLLPRRGTGQRPGLFHTAASFIPLVCGA